MEVFSKFHQVPFSKMLTFYRRDTFSLEAKYTTNEDLPIVSRDIGKIVVHDFKVYLYYQRRYNSRLY